MSYSSRSSLFLKWKSISQNKAAFLARKFYGLAMVLIALIIFIMPPIQKVLSNLDFWIDAQVRSVYDTSAVVNNKIKVFKTNFVAIFNAASAVAQLKQENEKLKAEAIALEAKNEEYSQLKSLSRLVTPNYEHVVTTRLVQGSQNGLGMGKILAGEVDGVRVGQFILSPAGSFLGKIIEVGSVSAKVLLITEPHSHLPVYFPRSQLKAILAGNYSGQLEIYFFDGDVSNLESGDAVVTSSEDEDTQSGLPVGQVIIKPGKLLAVAPVQDPRDIDIVSVSEVLS
jgi:rod shape-determining protein MreC